MANNKILYLIYRRDWDGSRIADVLNDLGYGIEFLCHPASGGADIADWFGDNETQLECPGVQNLPQQLRLSDAYETSIQSLTERFVRTWLTMGSDRVQAA